MRRKYNLKLYCFQLKILTEQLRLKDGQLDQAKNEMDELVEERSQLQKECLELSRAKDDGTDRLMELQQAIANRDELMALKQRWATIKCN